MPEQTAILLPVYNDQASLRILLEEIAKAGPDISASHVFIVNDGSTENDWALTQHPFPIQIIHLVRNLGHQRAIAIGLSHIAARGDINHVIVMDSDGEDRPSDIPALLAESRLKNRIIFASRRNRSNGLAFMMWYRLFRFSFYWLTGHRISFGNFSCIPGAALGTLVHYPELWSHYSGTVIRSGLPFDSIPINRGRRYAGESRMSFTSLVWHGFGALSVFIEKISTRVAVASFLLMLLALFALGVILVTRLATDLAIPGWASTLGSSMLIILLVSFVLSLMSVFIFLSSQSYQKIVPARHYTDYILKTESARHES